MELWLQGTMNERPDNPRVKLYARTATRQKAPF